MAVVTRKSTAITNRDATPRVLTNAGAAGGREFSFAATLEAVSGDDIASKYILGSIPSNAYNVQVELWSDDIGTTTIADFGLYRTTADGGAVVDADFFGSAVSLKDGAVGGTRIEHESAVYDLNALEKPLWQAAGATADPVCLYDLVATLTAASDGAATVAVKVRYTL
jgi:hypothetical protein